MALKPLQEMAPVEVPDPDDLIQRSRGDVLGVGRDHRRYAILYRQCQDMIALLNVPQTDGAIPAAGDDDAAEVGEIERGDTTLVAREGVANLPLLDVPELEIDVSNHS